MKKLASLSLFLFFIGSRILFAQQQFEQLEVKTNGAGIESLILGTDKKTLITGDKDGYVCLWDIETMTITKKTKERQGIVNSILFDQTGTKFVTAGEGGVVCVYEYPSGNLIKSVKVTVDENTFAAFSADGNYIYYGGVDFSRAYDDNRNMYKEPYGGLYRLDVNNNYKSELAFTDETQYSGGQKITDGNMDATGQYCVFTRSGELMFYDVTNKRMGFRIAISGTLNNLTPTADGMYVWGDKYLYRLEKSSNRYVVKQSILAGTRDGSYGYSKMVLSSNGKYLVTGDDESFVNIWDPMTLDKKQQLSGHTDAVRTFVFCNDDSVLVTGGYDGKLIFWGTPKPKEEPKDTTPVITDVVFTENNVPVSIKDREVELQSTITVDQTEFIIEVYDQSMVDGDSISLNLNGEWILESYMVVKNKLSLKIKIDPKFTNNYLILYAHNLGEFSPNTAAVQVIIGDKKYKLQLSSDLTKSGALNFSYVPKE